MRVIASLSIVLSLASASCSDGDETQIDYSVRFTDGMNNDRGEVAPAESFKGLSLNKSVPLTLPAPGMATLEIKSEMNVLRFSILESSGARRVTLACREGKGSGVAQAKGDISVGGHFLLKVNYKNAACQPEQ